MRSRERARACVRIRVHVCETEFPRIQSIFQFMLSILYATATLCFIIIVGMLCVRRSRIHKNLFYDRLTVVCTVFPIGTLYNTRNAKHKYDTIQFFISFRCVFESFFSFSRSRLSLLLIGCRRGCVLLSVCLSSISYTLLHVQSEGNRSSIITQLDINA